MSRILVMTITTGAAGEKTLPGIYRGCLMQRIPGWACVVVCSTAVQQKCSSTSDERLIRIYEYQLCVPYRSSRWLPNPNPKYDLASFQLRYTLSVVAIRAERVCTLHCLGGCTGTNRNPSMVTS